MGAVKKYTVNALEVVISDFEALKQRRGGGTVPSGYIGQFFDNHRLEGFKTETLDCFLTIGVNN